MILAPQPSIGRPASKTLYHTSAHTKRNENNTTIPHHHPSAETEKQRLSYHIDACSETFHNENQYERHTYHKHDQETYYITHVARSFTKRYSTHSNKQNRKQNDNNTHTYHHTNTTFTTPTIVQSMSNVALSISTFTLRSA